MTLCASGALKKWLGVDLPRMPHADGEQAGVNRLVTDDQYCSWQLHIIDNYHRSKEQTIIACEAHSRFVVVMPVVLRLTPEMLVTELLRQWKAILIDTVKMSEPECWMNNPALPDILDTLFVEEQWFANVDLSIQGHITDTSLWVKKVLIMDNLSSLSSTAAHRLSVEINRHEKKVKNVGRFVPAERMWDWCETLLMAPDVRPLPEDTVPCGADLSNVVFLHHYRT